MDKNKFKEFLESVGEVKAIKPTKTQSVRQSDEDEIEEVKYDGRMISIGFEDNPTLGFKLVKLKENIRACELGCGQIVADQKIEKRFATSPLPHWKTRCGNCGFYLSPDGKELLKGGHLAQSAYVAWFNKNK